MTRRGSGETVRAVPPALGGVSMGVSGPMSRTGSVKGSKKLD
jgi:hypothetical protein